MIRRFEFQSTAAESTEVMIRLATHGSVYVRERRRQQWQAGMSFAAVAMLMSALQLREASLNIWVAVAVIEAVVAVMFGLSYGRFHNWWVRGQARRLAADIYGDDVTIHTEIELRPDTVWTRQNGVELAFPWRSVTHVTEVSDGLELWFEQGLVLLRNRIFADAAQRADVLDSARQHARTRIEGL